MASWRKVLDLTPEERALLIESAYALPLVSISLSLFGLRRTQSLLRNLPAHPRLAAPASAAGQARAAARIVDAVANRVPLRATCLARSVTLWWLLRRRGVETGLRIGVQREAGAFHAHAWVEYEGQPINEQTALVGRFAQFSLPD